MRSVEVNDALECEFIIGADRLTPEESQARICRQCKRQTWAHTDACMWCGHDATTRLFRWVLLGLGLIGVIFTLIIGMR
ncbi:hypothetical protein ASD35_24150 [Pelomonas sp. Root1444]|nr:hypothetical protein ASD35_24150 [Pelomonas sp. Root1444]